MQGYSRECAIYEVYLNLGIEYRTIIHAIICKRAKGNRNCFITVLTVTYFSLK